MGLISQKYFWLGSLATLFFLLTACSNGQSEQKGDGGMFGLLGKKEKKTLTVVAKEVAGLLQAETSEPKDISQPEKPAFSQCQLGYVQGNPHEGLWVPEDVTGETELIYRIPGGSGWPPLALFATGEKRRLMQLWELSEDKQPRFLKQRTIDLADDQDSWYQFSPFAVTCLPEGRVLVAVGYDAPHSKEALFIYNPANNRFRAIGAIQPDMSTLPFVHFETLGVEPNAMLVLYHTDELRLGASNYVHKYDHVWLFSPRYPKGLEILKLGLDDGNVRGWGMKGKTLWIRSQDKRKKPTDFLWSLDLNKVL